MARIPEHKVDEIRSLADVVEVVGEYVQLKKRGTNFIGLCPFHGEKTPSFNVNPARQIYKCFGCGKAGDAVKFVSEIEQVSYADALKLLADKYNIELPKFEAQERQEAAYDALYEATAFAARFFYREMIQSEVGKKRGLSYFQGRHFSAETIKTFGLGFSPDAWDKLLLAATEKGITEQSLAAAGLILPNKKGDGFYDRFRNRAMFPIFSHIGKVIGFGGRILIDDKKQPKYINSPETAIYQKSKVLYGLSHAKNEIRGKGEVILTEGYTDVISLYQEGVKNVVSSSGTALSNEQIKLLSRYTKEIVLLYDADNAGMNAALRGMDLIFEQGLSVQLVSLPKGQDPDSYVREFGGQAFRNFIAQNRVDFLTFTLENAKAQGNWQTPEKQATVLRTMVQTISVMPDTFMRDGYLQKASILLKIPEMDLRQELDKVRRGKRNQQTPIKVVKTAVDAPIFDEDAPPFGQEVTQEATLHPSEELLLRIMLDNGLAMVELVLGQLALDNFTEGKSRALAEKLLEQYQLGHIDCKKFLNGEEGIILQSFVAQLLTDKHELSPRWKERLKTGIPKLNEKAEKAVQDAIKELHLFRVQEALESNRKAVFELEKRGEDDAALLRQQMELFRLRTQLLR